MGMTARVSVLLASVVLVSCGSGDGPDLRERKPTSEVRRTDRPDANGTGNEGGAENPAPINLSGEEIFNSIPNAETTCFNAGCHGSGSSNFYDLNRGVSDKLSRFEGLAYGSPPNALHKQVFDSQGGDVNKVADFIEYLISYIRTLPESD